MSFQDTCLNDQSVANDENANSLLCNPDLLLSSFFPDRIGRSVDATRSRPTSNESMTATNMTPTEKNASPGEHQHLHDDDDDGGDDFEEKIVQEFSHLLEKSKQLFNGLRCVLS